LNFEGQDVAHLVVADTTPGWPAHDELAIPRGARLVAVDAQPVADWYELVRVFRSRAGQTVRLVWEYGRIRGEGPMPIPDCLTAALDLPATAQVLSINGKEEVAARGHEQERFWVLPYWQAVKELCRDALGDRKETVVQVAWLDRLTHQRFSKQVTLTPQSIDPWLERVRYPVEDIRPEPDMIVLQAKNPLRAMWIGIKKTEYYIYQTYLTIERMIITRTVGIEHISGPVGIVRMGSEIAGGGMTKLLYFLGFISASLAVINFLPFPIVDGGIMVFLLIEKIKGQPVSLKLQAITQLVGLVLIIGAFVFITIQDIVKLSG
jgi:membrane-associated protease RseP (regulator of RpoE activity)